MSSPDYDKFSISTVLLNGAKRWFWASMIIKTAAAGFALLSLLAGIPTGTAAFIAFAFVAVAEVVGWQADCKRSVAQSLKDKLDLEDGFGWPIKPEDFLDILAATSSRLKREAQTLEKGKSYFDSLASPGAQRALENIEESAWWSKTLARQTRNLGATLAGVAIAATIISILVGLLFLLRVDPTLPTPDAAAQLRQQQETFARAAMLIFAAVPSIGLIRATMQFGSFANKAEKSENKARELLKARTYTEVEAVRTVMEYYAARSAAPAIPTWIYLRNQDELNRLWAGQKGDHRMTAKSTG